MVHSFSCTHTAEENCSQEGVEEQNCKKNQQKSNTLVECLVNSDEEILEDALIIHNVYFNIIISVLWRWFI